MAKFFFQAECTINTDEIVVIRPYTDEIAEVVLKCGETVRYEMTYDELLANLIRNEDK